MYAPRQQPPTGTSPGMGAASWRWFHRRTVVAACQCRWHLRAVRTTLRVRCLISRTHSFISCSGDCSASAEHTTSVAAQGSIGRSRHKATAYTCRKGAVAVVPAAGL